MRSHGWLFDVYPLRTAMVVWLYQDDGTLLRLEDPFHPRLYARGPRSELRRVARTALRTGLCRHCLLTTEREFWSGAVLRPLLVRRVYGKARLQDERLDPALARCDKACQRAIKWIGVSAFGYLSYRNARFGRIESHEAVTAFGRETLRQAKEICEAHGYELLHALMDAVWIRQSGLTDETLLALCAEISAATGITMSLEGRYRWIVFLPSKVRPELALATRYFGVFADGRLRARGLAYRRHDVPVFVQATQWLMLEALAAAEDLAGCGRRSRPRWRSCARPGNSSPTGKSLPSNFWWPRR